MNRPGYFESSRSFLFGFIVPLFCSGLFFGTTLAAQTSPGNTKPGAGVSDEGLKNAKENSRNAGDVVDHWKNIWKKETGGQTRSQASSDNTGDKTGEQAKDRQRFKNPGNAGKPGTSEKSGAGTQKKPAGATPAEKRGGSSLVAQNIQQNRAEDSSFVGLFLQFFGVMSVLLGGFYLVMRFLKNKTGSLGGGNDLVQVIASVPLVQGKFIQIVDLAGKLMVLGVADSGVNMLAEIEDSRTADRIRLWQSNRVAGAALPEGLLEKLTGLIKGGDFRFWNQAAESGRQNEKEAPPFKEMLRRQGGQIHPAPGSPPPPNPTRGGQREPAQTSVISESERSAGGERAEFAYSDLEDDYGTDAAHVDVTRNRPRAGRDQFGNYTPLDYRDGDMVDETHAPHASYPENQDLQELLKAQRRRLAALKKRG